MTLGILLGLFIGKQLGVYTLCLIFIKLNITSLPKGMSLTHLYGVAALTGIGFSMSLFIGTLAFEENNTGLIFDERLGIILGSLLSGILGYSILRFSSKKFN